MAKKQKSQIEGAADVRVLVDCDLGRANDVVSLTKEQIEGAADGTIDATPEAVDYARTLPQNAE